METEGNIVGPTVVLQCTANGKFVQAYPKSRDLVADSTDITRFCHFKLLKLPTGQFKIFSTAYSTFVSAQGLSEDEGYLQLRAGVEDEQWSRFHIIYDESAGVLHLKTAVAFKAPFVTAWGKERRLFVSEIAPTAWSYFMPYRIDARSLADLLCVERK